MLGSESPLFPKINIGMQSGKSYHDPSEAKTSQDHAQSRTGKPSSPPHHTAV
jgi:hypothetical protein